MLDRLFGFRQARMEYERIRTLPHEGTFPDLILSARKIRVDVSRHDTIRIPRRGPCIVVSNHPLGAMDGVALLSEMLRIRKDVRILANEVLLEVEELRPYIIPVDVLDKGAAAVNAASMRGAYRHVASGGMLIAFPAGEVSTLRHFPPGIHDRTWSVHMARMAQILGADVVPAFVKAANSGMFHLVGLLHPRMRTLMLVREMLRFRDRDLAIVFGSPMRATSERARMSAEEFRDELRFRSDFLRFKVTEERVPAGLTLSQGEKVIDDVSAYAMAAEVDALEERHRLMETEEFLVIAAEMRTIPTVMREIGRLREITFRLAGEGSGKSCDIDVFDSMYTHIVLWSKTTSAVAGAYRVGRVDELLRRYGRHGLYGNTLFGFSDEALEDLSQSLELGRSFVRPEYQRDPSVLALLLRGIGTYVARYPHYRYLMGAVSISDAYTDTSKRLMVNSLMAHHYDARRASGVKPRRHVGMELFRNWDGLLHSRTVLPVTELDTLVRDVEPNGKGVPVLLRHYLLLGGKITALHRDVHFGNCIDALIIVDLHATNDPLLRRHMGADGLQTYRQSVLRSGTQEPDVVSR
ncbi:MAG: lysophospholipid acyltransferase family protein [Candidatus Kapaibacterium sp.]